MLRVRLREVFLADTADFWKNAHDLTPERNRNTIANASTTHWPTRPAKRSGAQAPDTVRADLARRQAREPYRQSGRDEQPVSDPNPRPHEEKPASQPAAKSEAIGENSDSAELTGRTRGWSQIPWTLESPANG